jgi:hypothetical protein
MTRSWIRGLALAACVVSTAVPGPDGAAAQEPTRSLHGALAEGLTCLDCHTQEAWSPLAEDMAFDHADFGGFVLEGRHADVSCAMCHEGLVFDRASGAQEECTSCHLDVHQGTIARPCSACHSVSSFTDLDPGVVHPADYPLEGAHLQTSCESCHTDDLGGAYAPLDRECATCHLDEYLSVPLVDHEELGFSTDCTECHSTLDFRDVAFDHFTVSGGFELIGRHSAIECTACHSLPDGGIPESPSGPEDCIACHLDDYEDEHGGSGFPTDCLDCHTPFDWDDADFEHASATGFALIEGHDQLLCIECHVGSSSETYFSPSNPEDCYACHVEDYEVRHAGTGFSTDCRACHQATTWEGATFEHAFVIDTGPHNRGCEECHAVPGDFGFFTCLTCHDQPRMDDKHSEEAGYSYDSPTCLSCHPTGRDS